MPVCRSAAFAVALIVVSVLFTGASEVSAAPAADPGNKNKGKRAAVESLHKDAVKARRTLGAATKKYEQRKKALDESERKLKRTLRELGAADAELNRMRQPLAELANASYQQRGIGAGGPASMFGSQDPQRTLRAAGDVHRMAADRERLVTRVTRLRTRRETLASSAQRLQTRNAVERVKVDKQVEDLKRQSKRSTKRLTAALDKLGSAGRDLRLEFDCDADKAREARKFPNGLVPDQYLCDLPQKGEQLRADAARSFYELNAAYRRQFGEDACVTDSYRSLGSQQSIYARRPGMSAVPGSSNHGKGTAVDFCGGVQNQGTPQFNWLEANAKKYGWFHPQWAYSNPFEPWHWEYDPDS